MAPLSLPSGDVYIAKIQQVSPTIWRVCFKSGARRQEFWPIMTAFWSKLFRIFLDEWWIRLRFRYAHVPSGNGIIERYHRSIKRITKLEAVYWHNVTPKDPVLPATAPAHMIYCYRARLNGIDEMSALPSDQLQTVYRKGDQV